MSKKGVLGKLMALVRYESKLSDASRSRRLPMGRRLDGEKRGLAYRAGIGMVSPAETRQEN